MGINVALTDEQTAVLEDYYGMARNARELNSRGVILAQVFTTHMVVTFVERGWAIRIQDILRDRAKYLEGQP